MTGPSGHMIRALRNDTQYLDRPCKACGRTNRACLTDVAAAQGKTLDEALVMFPPETNPQWVKPTHWKDQS